MTLKELDSLSEKYKIPAISVDFLNHSYHTVQSKQLDNSRYLICTLTENGIPRAVRPDEIARLRLEKPDKTYVYNECETIEDGRILVTLTEQILAVKGKAQCDIQLTSINGIIYSTKNFIINIDSVPYPLDAIESSDEFDALNDIIAREGERIKIVEELEQTVTENEAVRNENENNRITSENIRNTNETARQNQETTRQNQEAVRQANENTRITNENSRKANETVRQTNETNRQNNTATAISNAEKATKKANDAADDLQNKLDRHHFVLTEDKDVAGGVPSLDTNRKVPVNELYEATVSSKGITQLTNSVTSTSTTTAATPNSVKTAYDKAISVNNDLQKHNSSSTAHDDIRVLISNLTTSKINIADIIDNLTSTATNKPLSAKQGKILKDLIATLTSETGNKVDKVSGKGLSTNDYTTTEKNKLSGISNGAEVNQNAFSNIVVGSTTITADTKTDTLTIAAGSNITLTPDATNDTLTITAKDTTYYTGTSSVSGVTKLYTGTGSATDGTMTQAAIKSSLDGKANASHGNHVPTTQTANNKIFLRNDNTWQTITPANIGAAASSHTHNYAGSSSAGGSANTVSVSRVAKNCLYKPGTNKLVIEEFTAGSNYNLPSNHWYHIYTAEGSDANYITQLALGMTTTAMYYRNCNNNTWSAWKSVLLSDNSTFLPLAGGTLTGTLTTQNIVPSNKDGYGIGSVTKPYGYIYSNYFNIAFNGGSYGSLGVPLSGSPSVVGETKLTLGNNIASGNNHNAMGSLQIYSNTKNSILLKAPSNLAASGNDSATTYTIFLPNQAGTLALTNHTHNTYLPLSGGTMTGTITTSKTTNTYLAGNQGSAIINSTAAAGNYTMLAKMNSTNGFFTHGSYQGSYLLQYTTKNVVNASTNNVTKSVTLLNESGNSSFPGTISANSFSVSSSRRYKTNIVEMTEEDAEKILNIDIKRFDYVIDDRKNIAGCIAEEVEQILPDVCTYTDDTKTIVEGIDYSKFVPYLIKLLQKQQKQINKLSK